jgi:hypothetical protein
MCEYLFRWEGYTGVTAELVGKCRGELEPRRLNEYTVRKGKVRSGRGG